MTVPVDAIVRTLDDAGLLVECRGALPDHVADVTDDSRAVGRGTLFMAVRGSGRDGHAYLDAAAAAGASAVIVEDAGTTTLPAIVVRDGRRAAALAASVRHDWPVRALCLAGVTGTNGKTTTVNMLRHLIQDRRRRSASIGTLGVLVGSPGAPLEGGSGLTTPGPVELQRVLRALVDDGVGYVAMEVSSHALDQHRAEGVRFDVAVFTNLSRDHLDYHKSMEAYRAAKARLVEYLQPHGTVVVNRDDPAWHSLPTTHRTLGFSERDDSVEVHATDIRFTGRGSSWTLALGDERHAVTLPLIGDFNVGNALAAAAAAYALGFDGAAIAERLATMPQIPGRLEVLSDRPAVLRDYAHTPDALERALLAVRPFVAGRLIAVFGCGGDRDPGKRPEMGAIAERCADLAIVTSDNPRTEDPEAILDDIERGMAAGRHERIEDRRAAIARAIALAGEGDVVLLAGKGHETYQIRGTTRLPFDEQQIVADILASSPTG